MILIDLAGGYPLGRCAPPRPVVTAMTEQVSHGWSAVILLGLLAAIGLLDLLAAWHVRREERRRDQRGRR